MTIYRSKHLKKKLLSGAALILTVAGLSFSGVAFAKDAPTLKFGTPTWPGVTVQSDVAAQLLNVMGFKTTQTNSSPAFILTGLSTGQLDIYLGGWMPTEAGLIKPLAKKGKVKILTTNISNALMGLAVPDYVWKAGVHSIADLNKFADKFDHKIYGIEAGSGFDIAIKKAIKANKADLGSWNMIPSSTSAALVQVERSIQRHEWIAFLAWEPHWMNIKFNIKYLKPVGKHEIARQQSNVLTVVNPEMVKKYPQATKFLKEFQVDKRTMSNWILEYSYKKRKPEDVASQWIGENLDQVAKWLKGVKTLDGESAIKAVRAKYAS